MSVKQKYQRMKDGDLIALVLKCIEEGKNQAQTAEILECHPQHLLAILYKVCSRLKMVPPEFPNTHRTTNLKGHEIKVDPSGLRGKTARIPQRFLSAIGAEVDDVLTIVYDGDCLKIMRS